MLSVAHIKLCEAPMSCISSGQTNQQHKPPLSDKSSISSGTHGGRADTHASPLPHNSSANSYYSFTFLWFTKAKRSFLLYIPHSHSQTLKQCCFDPFTQTGLALSSPCQSSSALRSAPQSSCRPHSKSPTLALLSCPSPGHSSTGPPAQSSSFSPLVRVSHGSSTPLIRSSSAPLPSPSPWSLSSTF